MADANQNGTKGCRFNGSAAAPVLFMGLTAWLVFVACLHLVFIFRFTTLLGHFPVPMIDDPQFLHVRDPFCDCT